MDPSLREYLDRLHQDSITHTDAVAAQAAQRSAALLASQEGMAQQLTVQTAQLRELTEWKPDLEARLARLQDAVAELQRTRHPTADAASGSASAHVDAPAPHLNAGEIHGPDGHRENIYFGGPSAVNTTSLSAPPTNGIFSLQSPVPNQPEHQIFSSQIMSSLGSNAPNFPFPQFSGDNPNLWKTLAEQYFTMFHIHSSYWVPMAILHFSGAAGIWLQSVQKKISSLEWISFTSLLCTRFGRDRHQLLIRQFYNIKQTSTVADYIERFDVLMNHLVSYCDTTHPFYFSYTFY